MYAAVIRIVSGGAKGKQLSLKFSTWHESVLSLMILWKWENAEKGKL